MAKDLTLMPLLRNVDKYYSLRTDATNWDNGWNSSDINNPTTGFRYRRINSDMSLIDFEKLKAVNFLYKS